MSVERDVVYSNPGLAVLNSKYLRFKYFKQQFRAHTRSMCMKG